MENTNHIINGSANPAINQNTEANALIYSTVASNRWNGLSPKRSAIILNLFIGIILNSMSEMHAEIAEVDSKLKTRQVDQPIFDEQLGTIERELQLLQERVRQIPRANTFNKPGGLQS